MTITFDHAKRDRTLAERGLDFLDARFVFDGVTVDFEDLRRDYGEDRFICCGHLDGRWSSSHGPRVARIATA